MRGWSKYFSSPTRRILPGALALLGLLAFLALFRPAPVTRNAASPADILQVRAVADKEGGRSPSWSVWSSVPFLLSSPAGFSAPALHAPGFALNPGLRRRSDLSFPTPAVRYEWTQPSLSRGPPYPPDPIQPEGRMRMLRVAVSGALRGMVFAARPLPTPLPESNLTWSVRFRADVDSEGRVKRLMLEEETGSEGIARLLRPWLYRWRLPAGMEKGGWIELSWEPVGGRVTEAP